MQLQRVQTVNDLIELFQSALLEELVLGDREDRGREAEADRPRDKRAVLTSLSDGECRRLVNKFRIDQEEWLHSSAESLDRQLKVSYIHFSLLPIPYFLVSEYIKYNHNLSI